MDAQSGLSEVEQIKQLKARYFRFMDTKQWQEWRSLFTDDMKYWRDATREPSSAEPVTESGDAFVAMVSKNLQGAITVHHGHMPEIELTGERTARGIWAMEDLVDNPAQGRAIRGYGHYHEEYEKGDDGRWRIKRMRLTRIRVDPVPPSTPA
jgi:hypothetical protein